jgi:hypothetical protein
MLLSLSNTYYQTNLFAYWYVFTNIKHIYSINKSNSLTLFFDAFPTILLNYNHLTKFLLVYNQCLFDYPKSRIKNIGGKVFAPLCPQVVDRLGLVIICIVLIGWALIIFLVHKPNNAYDYRQDGTHCNN